MKTLIVVAGPTGIGKTDFSISLAQKLNTEIISCDSRQMFRELKIGTAVPEEAQLKAVKHHFIGNCSIHDYYNASMFEFEVIDLLQTLFQTHNEVVMTGGSGLYINAVCYGIDDLPTIDNELREELHNKWITYGIETLRFELKKLDPDYYAIADLSNPKRLLKALEVCYMTGKPYSSFRTAQRKERNFNCLRICLQRDREELYNIVDKRVDKMVEAGLVEEAQRFLEFKLLNSLNTVGYKELFPYFEGEYSLEKAIELIKRNTRHYVKRQLSWFHRDGNWNWFHREATEKIFQFIEENISKENNL